LAQDNRGGGGRGRGRGGPGGGRGRGRGRGRGPGRGRRPQQDRRDDEFDSEIIDIRRVSKVTKGGKNFSFRVTAVVGDHKGQISIGKGNAIEIPAAMQKAIRDAKKTMIKVPIVNGTLPHEALGKFKAANVVLRPAYPGTGIIAGRTVGTICRIAGIDNILTKALDSTNPLNLARATIEGFKQMRTPEQVAALRDKTVEDLAYETE